jgi:hypothetical protein
MVRMRAGKTSTRRSLKSAGAKDNLFLVVQARGSHMGGGHLTRPGLPRSVGQFLAF